MKANKQQIEYAEPEISLLREWLLKINREYRAYIKGASKALLYAQELQGAPSAPGSPGFESKGSR